MVKIILVDVVIENNDNSEKCEKQIRNYEATIGVLKREYNKKTLELIHLKKRIVNRLSENALTIKILKETITKMAKEKDENDELVTNILKKSLEDVKKGKVKKLTKKIKVKKAEPTLDKLVTKVTKKKSNQKKKGKKK